MSLWKCVNGNLIEAPNTVYHRDYVIRAGEKHTGDLPGGWQEHPDEVSARQSFGLPPLELANALEAEGIDIDEDRFWRVVRRIGQVKRVGEEVSDDGYVRSKSG